MQQLPAVARILFRSVCQSGEPTRSPAQQDAGHQVCCRGRRVRTFTSLSNFTVLPVAVGPAQARTSTAAAVRSHLEPEVEQRWRPARSVFFPPGGATLSRAGGASTPRCVIQRERVGARRPQHAGTCPRYGRKGAERKQAEDLQPDIRHIWKLLLKEAENGCCSQQAGSVAVPQQQRSSTPLRLRSASTLAKPTA